MNFPDPSPFEREFNGLRKFEPVSRAHPALGDILQIGRDEAEGCYYYVMELADSGAEANGQGSVIDGQSPVGRGQSPDPARGSFKAWPLQIARRRIADQIEKRACDARLAVALLPGAEVRSSPRGPDDSTRTATLERVPDPAGTALEHHWDEEWRRHVAEAATAREKAQVSAKQFQIFELYVMRGWPAVKVARTLGVSLASVYLAKHRVGSALKKQVRALEQTGTGWR